MGEFILPAARFGERLIERHVLPRLHQANLRQFLVRQRERHHFQHRQQRKILLRIVQQAQQRFHIHDFRQVEIAFRAVVKGRNPLFRQRIDNCLRQIRCLRKQNHHVAVRNRLSIRHRRSQKLLDAPRHHARLCLQHFLVASRLARTPLQRIPDVRPTQQVHHHGRIVLPRTQPANQLILRRIGQLRHRGAHRLPEHAVRRIQHREAASEVLLEHDFPLPRPLVFRKRLHPPQKECRVGLAEAVNRLLHVPDHEQAVLFPVDGLQNRVLHLTHVLALIHENVVKLPLHLRPHFQLLQNVERVLLHVPKVHAVPGVFLLAEMLMRPFDQCRQPTQLRLNRRKFPFQLRKIGIQQLVRPFCALFDCRPPIAEALPPFLFFRRQAAFRGQSWQGEVRNRHPKRLPLQTLQCRNQLRVCIQCFHAIHHCIRQVK